MPKQHDLLAVGDALIGRGTVALVDGGRRVGETGASVRSRSADDEPIGPISVVGITAATMLGSRDAPAAPAGKVDVDFDLTDARSPAAFAAFYQEQYAPMVRVAFLILGSREQAEEIVQEAFVRVHGRWSQIDNPTSYLRAAVVNGCRDTIRRLVRYRRREPQLVGPTHTVDAPDELSDALARLNSRQRTVLVLKFYGGLQEAEIAETLHMKVGTVKSTISRGIDRLRQELSDDRD